MRGPPLPSPSGYISGVVLFPKNRLKESVHVMETAANPQKMETGNKHLTCYDFHKVCQL